MQPPGGLRGFVARPIGRVALIALAITTLSLSLLFTPVFIAIVAFLVFGLGLPIYLGWKRPRQLAVAGLVILLITAPVLSVIEVYDLRQPSPWGRSADSTGGGRTGALLQRAHVSPFDGAAGGTYTFSVEIHPEFLPSGYNLTWIYLYVSTCQYPTTNSSPFCPHPYPWYWLNHSFAQPLQSSLSVSFPLALPGAHLWWWNIAAYAHNRTNHSWTFLNPPPGYPAMQGPVSGDFFSTLAIVIPLVYLETFLYPGLVFYIILLIYVLLKSREARRKGARDPAMFPPPTAATIGAATPVPAGSPAIERACPNCKAVVYPDEARCWKCGATLSSSSAQQGTLPSGKIT